jgi:hypothetical protein
MMMVRQNMMPVLPLLVVYAFWEHGWKATGLLISGLVVVLLIHITYWPDILQLWSWVPFIHFPAEIFYSGGGTPIWTPDVSLSTRVLSVFQAVRFHFVALVGSVISVLFWPKLADWKSRADFRIALFLLALFLGLIYMHTEAAIVRDYCVFCFTPYIAFFNVAGILLLAVSIKSWNWHPSSFMQTLIVIIFLVLFAGMGFSAFEDIGSSLLNFPAPRVRDLRILPGYVTWWDILSNKFHLNNNMAMRYVSTVFGLLAGGLIILVGYIIWRRTWRDKVNFGAFIASAILIIALILSPVLHGKAALRDCRSDVILANEKIGTYLRGIIPQGSLIYWNGGLSTAPLLYLPGVSIFPAQINNGYSFLSNGDTAELYKFGFWNEEMDSEWRATAQFFIIEGKRYESGWKEFFSPEQFDEFERSPVGTSCLEESYLRVFRRK